MQREARLATLATWVGGTLVVLSLGLLASVIFRIVESAGLAVAIRGHTDMERLVLAGLLQVVGLLLSLAAGWKSPGAAGTWAAMLLAAVASYCLFALVPIEIVELTAAGGAGDLDPRSRADVWQTLLLLARAPVGFVLAAGILLVSARQPIRCGKLGGHTRGCA